MPHSEKLYRARSFSFRIQKEQEVGLSQRLPAAAENQDIVRNPFSKSCPVSSSSRACHTQKLKHVSFVRYVPSFSLLFLSLLCSALLSCVLNCSMKLLSEFPFKKLKPSRQIIEKFPKKHALLFASTACQHVRAVSYTHLTLPTILLV